MRKTLAIPIFFLLFSMLFINQTVFVHADSPITTTFYLISEDMGGTVSYANADYTTCQSATTGSSAYYTGTLGIGQFSSGGYTVYRSFFNFDTRGLSGATITGAKLCLYGNNDGSTTDFNIRLQSWTESSDGLSTADFNGFDGTNYDDGSFSTSGFSTSTYNNITISNLSLVNAGGFTAICVRSSRDISATTPTGEERVYVNSQNYGGYSQMPLLEVTYTDGATSIEDYADLCISNVDSSASVGTQSNFTAQKFGPDLINDTLTEANTAGTTTSSVFSDGFEAGNFNLWDQNGATTWTGDGGILTAATGNLEGWASTPHAGTYHAGTGATGDGALTTDNMDLTSIVNFGISFWYAVDDTDGASELVLTYYDGAAYDTIQDLSGGTEDTWTYYSAIVTDSQYFDATFRVQFIAACGSNEAVFIDDFAINKTVNNPANYRLDIEEQWTSLNYTRANEELCIFMGPYTNTEQIYAQVWYSSAWVNITNLNNLAANSWNNASVTSWLTADTFTIRFLDGTQSSDSAQSTWQIDACLLHTWETAGNASSFTLTVSVSVASTNSKSFTLSRTLTQTTTITGTQTATKAIIKSLTATAAATSNLATIRGCVFLLSQTVSATESNSTQKAFTRILAQTITASSSSATQKALARLLSETVEANADVATVRGVIVALLLSLTVSDSSTYQKALARANSETVTSTSALQSQKALSKLLAESMTATATLKAVRGVLFSLLESVSVSSDLATQKALVRLLAEAVTSTSTLATQKTLTMLLSESASATSNLNAVRGVIFALLESLGISDSEATQKAINKALAETASSVSGLAVNKALIRLLVELLSASEDFDYSIGISVEALEVLLAGTTSVSGNLDTQKALTKLLSATANSSDSFASLKALQKFLAASAAASDGFAYNIGIGAKFLEFILSGTGTIADQLAAQKALSKILSASVNPQSSVDDLKALIRILTATPTATDSFSYNIGIGAKFLEFALSGLGTVTGNLDTQKALTRILAQTVSPTTAFTVQKSLYQQIVEVLTGTLTATSQLATQIGLTRTFSETATALASLFSSTEIHVFFEEFLDLIRIDSFLRSPFPAELMSVDDAIAMAVVACMISGAVVGTMFMVRRKRNEDY